MSTDDATGDDVAAPTHSAAADPESLALYARSFGAAAADYAAHRPDYPTAALDWALAPVRGRTVLRVLDLAAGTGILTRALVGMGLNVIAVEPDPAMRAELLAGTVGAAALAGSAEAIPLPDNRVDAVFVGQAYHWFDPERALPEIARVLTPGGVLALLWNFDDDRVPWVARLRDYVGDPATAQRGAGVPVPRHSLFADPERAEFPHTHRRTADSLAATLGTHSPRMVLDPASRAAWQRDTLAHLRADPDLPAGEFDVPLITYVVRSRLR